MASEDRNQLLKELRHYVSGYAVELAFRDRFVKLLREHDNCFERSLLSGHITGSAWILDEEMSHAFLTHHAKLDRWLQPGGHADGDEKVSRVALKEAYEETGMKNLHLVSGEVFDLDIHTIPERKGIPEHEHFDIRYLIIAGRDQSYQVSEESHDLTWLPLEKIGDYTCQNNSIQRMVEKTVAIKGKMSPRRY